MAETFLTLRFGDAYTHPVSRAVIVSDILDKRSEQLTKYPLSHDDSMGTNHLVTEAIHRLTHMGEFPTDEQAYETFGEAAAMLIAAMEVLTRAQDVGTVSL
jgi:malic enzyme